MFHWCAVCSFFNYVLSVSVFCQFKAAYFNERNLWIDLLPPDCICKYYRSLHQRPTGWKTVAFKRRKNCVSWQKTIAFLIDFSSVAYHLSLLVFFGRFQDEVECVFLSRLFANEYSYDAMKKRPKNGIIGGCSKKEMNTQHSCHN